MSQVRTRHPVVVRRVDLNRPSEVSRRAIDARIAGYRAGRLARLEAEEDRLLLERALAILDDPTTEYVDWETAKRELRSP